MTDHELQIALGNKLQFISDSIWGGGGGTRHFFLLSFYNFKNIWGGGHVPPQSRYSTVPDGTESCMFKAAASPIKSD